MLTNVQKSAIRMCLGYPDLFRYQSTRLESILNSDQLSKEAEDLIVQALNNFAIVETHVLGTSISMSGLKKVGDIEMYQGKSTVEIRGYGKMYVGRISIILGVPIYSDVFSGVGYLGDSFSGPLGQASGGGGKIRLG